MPTIEFCGKAQAVAQVETITIGGTPVANDTVSVTINNKTVTYTVVTATVAAVCTGLASALSNATDPEFAELSWEATSTTVVGTAVTAGVPHTISVAEVGTCTIATTTTIEATGPNHVDNVDNWVGGVLPTGADSIVLANSSASLLYGWPGSQVNLANCRIEESYTGDIGLPKVNELEYQEYRTTVAQNWRFDSLTVNGRGTYRFWKFAADAVIEINRGTVWITGSPSTAKVEVNGGTYYHGISVTETALAAEVRVASGASCIVHDDATITAAYNSGTLRAYGTVTGLTQWGGASTLYKNPATFDVLGGTLFLNGTEDVTTGAAGPGSLNLSQAMDTFAIGTWNGRAGCTVSDPNRRCSTFTSASITYN